jgi:hypothetical protein
MAGKGDIKTVGAILEVKAGKVTFSSSGSFARQRRDWRKSLKRMDEYGVATPFWWYVD